MNNSWPRDLAMSASANAETAMIYALFHGCDEQDMEILTSWLKMTTYSAGHPVLLPALFAELQLRRHKRLTRNNWSKLVTLNANTGQYRDRVPGVPLASLHVDTFDYDNTTREVLQMFQDTGFLEKDLVKTRRGLKQMISQQELIRTTMSGAQSNLFATENVRIARRLEEMTDDYEALIAECKVITDGASLLNTAVSLSFAYSPSNANN